MAISLYTLTLVFIFVYAREVCTILLRTFEWNFMTIHRDINYSIVKTTQVTDSVIHCAFTCSVGKVSLYYVAETGLCHCNSQHDTNTENNSTYHVQYGYLPFNQSDCLTWYKHGYVYDGVYIITGWDGKNVSVQCDMTNGGWTIIQRRLDGSENFYRGWSDYRAGFGDAAGEYWIGLDNLHHLTVSDSEMSVYLESFPDVTPSSVSAHYTHFFVGDNASEFLLSVSGFSGTCGDAITSNGDGNSNGRKFTTFDNDNDLRVDANCAVVYKGGWWHNHCHCTNPNGRYFRQGYYVTSIYFGQGLHWCACWNHGTSAKSILLKIRRTQD